jgi:hypothetical protein
MEYKSQKNLKNEMTTFWETIMLLTLKRQDLVQIFKTSMFFGNFLKKNCAQYCLDPVPDFDP